MRGRGLKPAKDVTDIEKHGSPPMRGRGLKLISSSVIVDTIRVAPHAGAWIETIALTKLYTKLSRRPPCGGVD